MVADARTRIEEIDTEALLSIYDDPEVVVVDIRDIRERQRSGWIPGSFHAPRGMVEFWIDPGSPYFLTSTVFLRNALILNVSHFGLGTTSGARG